MGGGDDPDLGNQNSWWGNLIKVAILYTVRKEINCCGEFEILREILRDTTRISSCFSDFV